MKMRWWSGVLLAVVACEGEGASESSLSLTQGLTERFLSDMAWSSADNGWGPVERDQSNGERDAFDGRPITLNGAAYAKGLGVHAPAELRYPLGGTCSAFRTDVGVDDEVGGRGSVVFQVWGDGALLYDSGAMTGSSATKSVVVDVQGRKELRLVVTDGGNSTRNDHADWAGARLACAAEAPSGQAPFGGAPRTIPGTIEAEDFDEGGQDVAFWDTEPENHGGAYRNTAVDVKDIGGGYAVGWLATGEWLEYTVDVAAEQSYRFDARVASATGGRFHVELDGVVKSTIDVPNTGAWDGWQSVSSIFALPAGRHVLRVQSDAQWFDLDGLTFTPASTIGGPPPSAIVLNPGDDLQAAVDAAPVGATLYLRAGVYRMQTIRPKDGQTILGEAGAILNGSRLLTSFSREGAAWVIGGQVEEGLRQGECFDGHPRCSYPEDLFVDDAILRHVGSLAEVGPGSWFFDYAADRIYVGDDPTGRKVEVSVTPNAIRAGGSNVTIRGLIVEKYATTLADVHAMGAVSGRLASGWIIEDNELRRNHSAGICPGDQNQVRRNHIHHNGMFGVVCGGSNSVLEDNEIAYNNTTGTNYYWGAGGSKFVLTNHLTLRGNDVHHNEGPGLWSDIDNAFVTYEGNRLTGNKVAGIFHEISWDAVIRNNVLDAEGQNPDGRDVWWGGAIFVSASTNVEVTGNTVRNSVTAIGVIDANRGTSPFTGRVWEARNIDVHHNTVVNPSVTAAGFGAFDPAAYTTRNIRFHDNSYDLTDPAGSYFVWSDWYVGRSTWQSYGHDLTGSFY